MVVVQHVDAQFAPDLAVWLRRHCPINVQVATPGCRPLPGTVWLAATNDHLVLTPEGTLEYCHEPARCFYRPSADVLFKSLAERWPSPGVAVLLTGMGRDGGEGLLALRKTGWHTIAQNEATSVVYGMPKAAVELGAARTEHAGVEALVAAGAGAKATGARAEGTQPAHLVVLLALLGVGEGLVSLADLLELLLGALVAGVLVGVEVPGELAERLLDVVLRGVLGHAERLVEVAHVSSPR